MTAGTSQSGHPATSLVHFTQSLISVHGLMQYLCACLQRAFTWTMTGVRGQERVREGIGVCVWVCACVCGGGGRGN